ncbi:MAG TPA: DUF4037 domain-containing protein [Rhizomicrobium sp.]
MPNGLTLCRAFYEQAIAPILHRHFPRLPYAAGLIGYGSEVLGYDSARSQDHHWGPRVLLFLRDADLAERKPEIAACLSHNLPVSFEGFSTNFGSPDGIGVRLPVAIPSGPVDHMVEIYSVSGFAQWRLGIEPSEPISNRRWLTLPQQRLLETTSGEIFHDGIGEITRLRQRLAYFPDDVWRYMLSCQWQKIAQEESFVGRAHEAGDALGSRLIAARLVREMMRLGFLMERRYWPYSKWFGTAFARLAIAPDLLPHLQAALAADDAASREGALSLAYELLAARHNALRITPPLETNVRAYYGRPYLTIRGNRFADAIRATLADPQIAKLLLVGSADQFTDSTDVIDDPSTAAALGAVYPPWD